MYLAVSPGLLFRKSLIFMGFNCWNTMGFYWFPLYFIGSHGFPPAFMAFHRFFILGKCIFRCVRFILRVWHVIGIYCVWCYEWSGVIPLTAGVVS